MIKRLDEVNQEFREINNFTKNSRKMSKSILKVSIFFCRGNFTCKVYLNIDTYLLKCQKWVFIRYLLVNLLRKLKKRN